MPVRGLTVLVAGADRDRFRSAATLAAAAAALGGRTRLFVDDPATALLADRLDDDIAALLLLARESGVEIVACQTGLARYHLSAATLDIAAGGVLDLLATLGDDRLVSV